MIVGGSVARGFAGVELGQQLSFAGRAWTVVGVFDAGKTGFDERKLRTPQGFRDWILVIRRLKDAIGPDRIERPIQRIAHVGCELELAVAGHAYQIFHRMGNLLNLALAGGALRRAADGRIASPGTRRARQSRRSGN